MTIFQYIICKLSEMINIVKSFSMLCNKNGFYQNNKFGMALIKFPLPDLGEKIKEGAVKKLYVQEGEYVEQFQKIADVQSDKQFTEITAPETGSIAKIYYKQSEICKVGNLFMQIQTKSDPTPTQSKTKTTKKSQSQNKKQSINHHSNANKLHDINWSQSILASPVVRIFAYTSKVDLAKVKGSGKRGRIVKDDIFAYMQGGSQEVLSEIAENKRVVMNPYQKGMQKSMNQSNKVPHLYYFETIDITETQRMRSIMKNHFMKVTLMGILTKTLSLALKEFPQLNSTYSQQNEPFQYKIHSSHNISLAIDSPNGLVAPNIKNVQNLSIIQIQKQLENLKMLSEKAQLTNSHLQNGTICLSNIGTIAGVSACPLILCPQTCIIAIGKVIQKPHFVTGSSSILRKKQIVLGFGCDHRVLDGATVARFSNQWKKILENPYLGLAKLH